MRKLRRSNAVRKLAVASALLLLAAVETFLASSSYWPKHETFTLLAVLDRLQSPGLLSRDLAVTHADLSLTVFDEATLAIHRICRVGLPVALSLQAGLCFLSQAIGSYLLLRTFVASRFLRLLLTASVVTLHAFWFGGPLFGMAGETTPETIAFGFAILAAGLVIDAKPLLAGLAGGLALLYDFRMAAPFWLLVLFAFVYDKRLRPLLKPLWWIFAVFTLLLANLAQLQPSPVGEQNLFRQITWQIVRIDQYRSPLSWVSTWSGLDFAAAFTLLAIVGAAVIQLWRVGNGISRWFAFGLPLLGVLSFPLTALLVDRYRLSSFVQLQTLAWLSFDAFFACLLAGAAFLVSLQRCQKVPAVMFAVLIAAALLSGRRGECPGTSTVPKREIADLAAWAENTTWGGSVFLFADAGREAYPAVFRAAAKRALWVDWSSGYRASLSQTFADEWWRRWQDTMDGRVTPVRIRSFLTLPIDYYVLKRSDLLPDVDPVFKTASLVVYDADDLRSTMPIRRQKQPHGGFKPAG